MRTGGSFNGTGAAVYLCFGFVPDWFKMWNTMLTDPITAVWNRNMTDILSNEGMSNSWGSEAGSINLAKGAGISQYYGKDVLTSTTAGTTTYGEGVYLVFDDVDYRYVSGNGPDPSKLGDALVSTIDTWTLGSSSNYTGNFNADVTGTYIAVGSSITIDGQVYCITALTASQGSAANEVTLSHAPESGVVQRIGGRYGMKPLIAGDTTPAGVRINDTSLVNQNDDKIVWEAGKYGH